LKNFFFIDEHVPFAGGYGVTYGGAGKTVKHHRRHHRHHAAEKVVGADGNVGHVAPE